MLLLESQTSAVENVVYCSVDVPTRRLESTDVLRGVMETHFVQLLGVILIVIHELMVRPLRDTNQ